MFVYEKKLQYPVKIKNPNPKLASLIISQYGGPDGELGASLRYLSQRYSMPYPELKGLLTDIGTEELGHLEMIGTIVHQLTRSLNDEDIRTGGFAAYRLPLRSVLTQGDVVRAVTEPMSAEKMHALAQNIRKDGTGLFFAALEEESC